MLFRERQFMKVSIDEVNPLIPTPKYPWVGKHVTEYTTVVLFTEPRCGFCLHSTYPENQHDRYADTWDEHLFVPCSITLSSLKDNL